MINYIHIPKAAGSSLYELIKNDHRIGYCGHVRVTDVPFVSFVRHPYDRLISAYFYLIEGGGQTEIDLSFRDVLSVYTDFKDFVLHIEQDSLIDKILHIKPMHWFLCGDDGQLLIDRYFKIEEMHKIDEFLAEVGFDKKLSDIHSNQSKHNHYTEYLDEEITREINRLYHLDFELFNYKTL